MLRPPPSAAVPAAAAGLATRACGVGSASDGLPRQLRKLAFFSCRVLAPPRLVRLRAGESPASTPRRLLVLLLPPVHYDRSARQAGNRRTAPMGLLTRITGYLLPLGWQNLHRQGCRRSRAPCC